VFLGCVLIPVKYAYADEALWNIYHEDARWVDVPVFAWFLRRERALKAGAFSRKRKGAPAVERASDITSMRRSLELLGAHRDSAVQVALNHTWNAALGELSLAERGILKRPVPMGELDANIVQSFVCYRIATHNDPYHFAIIALKRKFMELPVDSERLEMFLNVNLGYIAACGTLPKITGSLGPGNPFFPGQMGATVEVGGFYKAPLAEIRALLSYCSLVGVQVPKEWTNFFMNEADDVATQLNEDDLRAISFYCSVFTVAPHMFVAGHRLKRVIVDVASKDIERIANQREKALNLYATDVGNAVRPESFKELMAEVAGVVLAATAEKPLIDSKGRPVVLEDTFEVKLMEQLTKHFAHLTVPHYVPKNQSQHGTSAAEEARSDRLDYKISQKVEDCNSTIDASIAATLQCTNSAMDVPMEKVLTWVREAREAALEAPLVEGIVDTGDTTLKQALHALAIKRIKSGTIQLKQRQAIAHYYNESKAAIDLEAKPHMVGGVPSIALIDNSDSLAAQIAANVEVAVEAPASMSLYQQSSSSNGPLQSAIDGDGKTWQEMVAETRDAEIRRNLRGAVIPTVVTKRLAEMHHRLEENDPTGARRKVSHIYAKMQFHDGEAPTVMVPRTIAPGASQSLHDTQHEIQRVAIGQLGRETEDIEVQTPEGARIFKVVHRERKKATPIVWPSEWSKAKKANARKKRRELSKKEELEHLERPLKAAKLSADSTRTVTATDRRRAPTPDVDRSDNAPASRPYSIQPRQIASPDDVPRRVTTVQHRNSGVREITETTPGKRAKKEYGRFKKARPSATDLDSGPRSSDADLYTIKTQGGKLRPVLKGQPVGRLGHPGGATPGLITAKGNVGAIDRRIVKAKKASTTSKQSEATSHKTQVPSLQNRIAMASDSTLQDAMAILESNADAEDVVEERAAPRSLDAADSAKIARRLAMHIPPTAVTAGGGSGRPFGVGHPGLHSARLSTVLSDGYEKRDVISARLVVISQA
jgi:hypothetical protein